MLGVIYGTTGELIKLAPVIAELRSRGCRPQLWCTGQQIQQIPSFQRDLNLPEVDVWLARGHRGEDLRQKRDIPVWTAEVAASLLRRRRELQASLSSDGIPFILVHGDTMTTVLGSFAAKALRVSVGHVEAGLRSHNWLDPFPEEFDRRLTAKLVEVNYAPGSVAVGNLRRERVRGEIVDTGQNTIRDALALALEASPVPDGPHEEDFGLVSIHRFELLERAHLLEPLLRMLHERSRGRPLLFIDHSTTRVAIERSPSLRGLFDERFRRLPRQSYAKFIALLGRARFLITDSGGSQEECALLGIPCLVHRARSEREAGIGETVVLSGLDLESVSRFLADPPARRAVDLKVAVRPSQIIVDDLAGRGVF